MPDPVNLKVPGEIAAVIDGVALRGHPLALARVGADGSPSVSFQGSALCAQLDRARVLVSHA